jgi:glutathione S-transferase
VVIVPPCSRWAPGARRCRRAPGYDLTLGAAVEVLELLDRHLDARDFVLDGRYSIADIALYGYTHVAPEAGLGLDPYPALRA